MIIRTAWIALLLTICSQTADAQATSTLCSFNAGPRAGSTHDYAGQPPAPVGVPCQDGQGSFGIVMPAGDSSLTIAGANPGTPAQGSGLGTICQFTSGPRAGGSYDYAQMGASPIRVGSPCHDGANSTGMVVAVASAGPAAGGMSTICRFTSGQLAGQERNYAPQPPVPVGSPCQDSGSFGSVVAPAAAAAGNMSTICRFSTGPRAGQAQDYAPMAPAPVGSQCHDGYGSMGQVAAVQAQPNHTQTCLFMAGPQRGYTPHFPNITPVQAGTPCWDGTTNFGVAVPPPGPINAFQNPWNGDPSVTTSVTPPPAAPVQQNIPPPNVTPIEVAKSCVTAGNQVLIAACMAQGMPPNVASQCAANPSACFGKGTPLAIQTKVAVTIAEKAGIDVGKIAGKIDRIFGKIKIF